jgi:chromosome segregation ATPase
LVKRKLSVEERQMNLDQIGSWELEIDVLNSDIHNLEKELKNLDGALKSKITALEIELHSLKNDYQKKITLRQISDMLTRKKGTLKRLTLNIQALHKQNLEGVEQPTTKPTPINKPTLKKATE